jgi:hypothetical protein
MLLSIALARLIFCQGWSRSIIKMGESYKGKGMLARVVTERLTVGEGYVGKEVKQCDPSNAERCVTKSGFDLQRET